MHHYRQTNQDPVHDVSLYAVTYQVAYSGTPLQFKLGFLVLSSELQASYCQELAPNRPSLFLRNCLQGVVLKYSSMCSLDTQSKMQLRCLHHTHVWHFACQV